MNTQMLVDTLRAIGRCDAAQCIEREIANKTIPEADCKASAYLDNEFRWTGMKVFGCGDAEARMAYWDHVYRELINKKL